jgi:DNA-binding XRE family transcriptional regulator
MLSPDLIEEIERLLAEGKLSQRKIAKRTGVSRGTVGAVANGKRHVHARETESWDAGLESQSGPPQHCPGCGGLVHLPCRLCYTRQFLAAHRARQLPDRPQAPLQFELQEEHAARLRRLVARRQRSAK